MYIYMKVFSKSTLIRKYLLSLKTNNKSIGFVPTMGALHKGHSSLIKQSKFENDITVVSIFINPTQFNNKTDLATYPKTLAADKDLLKKLKCDILFLPDVKDIYPNYPKIDFLDIDLGKLNTTLEAKHRQGHFKGVATVVNCLFKAVPATFSYFGKKDFQQILVIKKLIETQNVDITVVECETVREKDGLAMSSRNVKLSEQERKDAGLLYKALSYIQHNYKDGIDKSIQKAADKIN